ncbi:hypothetical protein DCC81_17900 [Chitinophaga parva]|uniref:HTH araC/xylS-type domain-containing protein n=1 Tax=Chitinophaga parva TaxID=2169414 RepID=A0A2T7BIN3_9BACT|nr:AraC family transcriptional regulator [Chitinophaga parva]PUZ26113.1 hypothetical protein DCC81_17900 [Chitinophaga parva]
MDLVINLGGAAATIINGRRKDTPAMGHEEFNLPAVARQTGISERCAQQLYLGHVGGSPVSFATFARFNKGLHLVRSTQMPLTDIAYECGYYDQAHFIRSFKKRTGITPSDARRSLAGNEEAFQQAVNIGF